MHDKKKNFFFYPASGHICGNISTPFHSLIIPRPGSVVVERSPGMREVGGSIPGRVKQKTLKFEVLLLCLAAQHNGVRDRLAGSESL